MTTGSITSIAARIVADAQNVGSTAVPELRVVRRAASKRLRGESPERVLGVVFRLLEHSAIPRWMSYELANQDPRMLEILTPSHVDRLGSGMASWGDVDAFGTLVAGPAWREGRVATDHVMQWTKSPDRWWRRAALVSTVALNSTARGGSGDPERTLAICSALVHDRDDMVVKAMSWALRELAKKDSDSVTKFLKGRESDLAPRVRREVRNKLSTGLKNPKRKVSAGGMGRGKR